MTCWIVASHPPPSSRSSSSNEIPDFRNCVLRPRMLWPTALRQPLIFGVLCLTHAFHPATVRIVGLAMMSSPGFSGSSGTTMSSTVSSMTSVMKCLNLVSCEGRQRWSLLQSGFWHFLRSIMTWAFSPLYRFMMRETLSRYLRLPPQMVQEGSSPLLLTKNALFLIVNKVAIC